MTKPKFSLRFTLLYSFFYQVKQWQNKNLKTNRILLSASVICLFVLAMIWGSYIRQRSFDRNDSIEFAIKRNANLVAALEQYTIRTLHNADAALKVVKMEYAEKGKTLNLQKFVKSISIAKDIDHCISIIGKDGGLKMTNTDSADDANTDFSGSPFFVFHSTNKEDSLLVSQPALSECNGKRVVVVSRRIDDEDGKFAGVVTLQISPSAFTAFYSRAHLLPNDIISLISPDGITYARRTGERESSGEDISKSPLFNHLSQHSDSFYFAPDAIRHIPTWFSYRKLDGYPIIATVGSSEKDILAEFTKRQPRFIIPRVMMSLLVILFTLVIAKFIVHRRKASELLIQKEEKYQRLLIEQMIAVQEREREWIGRELHDNVNQVLTTVKLYLEVAAKDKDHPLIPRSMQLVNHSIVEIRNLSHQLSAPTLGTGSLVDSMSALIENVSLSSTVDIRFDYTGYTGVSRSQTLALYRILQEQLTNIVKHAEATKVWVSLSQKGNAVVLTVKDNGKGFDTTHKTTGMGLNNMISRVKVFGGKVDVVAAPKTGCVLSVSMPAAAEEFCEN